MKSLSAAWMGVIVFAGSFLGGAAMMLALHGRAEAQTSSIISAREFRLIDGNGKTSAALWMGNAGRLPMLSFYNGGTKPVAEMSAKGVFVHRADSSAALTGYGLGVLDSGGVVRTSVYLGNIGLSDAKARSRAVFSLSPQGNPSLALEDEKQRGRLVLAAGTDSDDDGPPGDSPGIYLYDAENRILWKAP